VLEKFTLRVLCFGAACTNFRRSRTKGSIEMRVFSALLFSSAVVLAPGLAAAEATAPAAPTAAPATTAPAANETPGANLDEIVCKNQPPATGTRLGGGRECHTVRQWNQRQRDAQDVTRKQEIGQMYHPGG
jgi:hypothetical protein